MVLYSPQIHQSHRNHLHFDHLIIHVHDSTNLLIWDVIKLFIQPTEQLLPQIHRNLQSHPHFHWTLYSHLLLHFYLPITIHQNYQTHHPLLLTPQL